MASPLSPLSVLLSAPLSPDDLDFELTKGSLKTLVEFEDKWKQFMVDYPHLIPKGKREHHIEELQSQVREIQASQQDVKFELQEQLAFFQRTRDTLEENYATQMEDTKTKQKEMNTHLQKQLDNVAIAEYLLSQAIASENFLENVDRAAEARAANPANLTSEREKTPIENFWNSWGKQGSDKKAKPSARAMVLVDDTVGDMEDIQLRAYRIDQALLKMQVRMLQKEIEGYEKLQMSQDYIGKFLTEHNIWVMLTKKENPNDKDNIDEKSLETLESSLGTFDENGVRQRDSLFGKFL